MTDFNQVTERQGTNSLKWTRYSKTVLPLWVADMDFPAPEPVLETLRSAIGHGIFGYELPGKKLARAVASRMEKLYGWKVAPEAVVATPGIVAGFHIAASAVCRAGEGILVQPPVYRPFLQLSENIGATLQMAPLRQSINAHTVRYLVDWPAFDGAFGSNGVRTAMFLLCHPHNPTGHIYAPADLERMAEACLRHNAVICSDEIHSELLLGNARHSPIAAISPEIASRTITLVSPSKTFNLVGLFCGFAIIPDAELRASFRRVIENQAHHVNSLGLIAAQVAFSGQCEAWLADLREYLTANRDYVVDFVGRELKGARVTVPDATYLAWLDFTELVQNRRLSPSPYEFLLRKAKVGLNPGADFGQGGENCARLNFGCPRATLEEALKRIQTAFLQA